jgi:flagellin
MSALVVNFNAEAANAVLNLDSTNSALSNAIQELSSGLAVQFSWQGPAQWSISQYLQYQNAGDTQGVQNAQQGVAVLNIASGAVNQIAGILDQMEQLAVSSANGGAMSATQQQANETQYKALLSEINQIVANTNYGTLNLLNGTYASETFQIGFQNTNTFTMTITNLKTNGVLKLSGTSVSTTAKASSAIASIQAALAGLSAAGASIGANQVQLQAFVQDLQTTSTNVASANSTVVDVNMAQEMTTFTTDQILLQSGLSMLGQAQANPTLVLKLL